MRLVQVLSLLSNFLLMCKCSGGITKENHCLPFESIRDLSPAVTVSEEQTLSSFAEGLSTVMTTETVQPLSPSYRYLYDKSAKRGLSDELNNESCRKNTMLNISVSTTGNNCSHEVDIFPQLNRILLESMCAHFNWKTTGRGKRNMGTLIGVAGNQSHDRRFKHFINDTSGLLNALVEDLIKKYPIICMDTLPEYSEKLLIQERGGIRNDSNETSPHSKSTTPQCYDDSESIDIYEELNGEVYETTKTSTEGFYVLLKNDEIKHAKKDKSLLDQSNNTTQNILIYSSQNSLASENFTKCHKGSSTTPYELSSKKAKDNTGLVTFPMRATTNTNVSTPIEEILPHKLSTTQLPDTTSHSAKENTIDDEFIKSVVVNEICKILETFREALNCGGISKKCKSCPLRSLTERVQGHDHKASWQEDGVALKLNPKPPKTLNSRLEEKLGRSPFPSGEDMGVDRKEGGSLPSSHALEVQFPANLKKDPSLSGTAGHKPPSDGIGKHRTLGSSDADFFWRLYRPEFLLKKRILSQENRLKKDRMNHVMPNFSIFRYKFDKTPPTVEEVSVFDMESQKDKSHESLDSRPAAKKNFSSNNTSPATITNPVIETIDSYVHQSDLELVETLPENSTEYVTLFVPAKDFKQIVRNQIVSAERKLTTNSLPKSSKKFFYFKKRSKTPKQTKVSKIYNKAKSKKCEISIEGYTENQQTLFILMTTEVSKINETLVDKGSEKMTRSRDGREKIRKGNDSQPYHPETSMINRCVCRKHFPRRQRLRVGNRVVSCSAERGSSQSPLTLENSDLLMEDCDLLPKECYLPRVDKGTPQDLLERPRPKFYRPQESINNKCRTNMDKLHRKNKFCKQSFRGNRKM